MHVCVLLLVIRSRQAAASSSTPMQESPSGFSSSQGTKGSVSGSSNANSDGSDSVDSKSGGSSERGGDSPPTYAEKAAVQMACKVCVCAKVAMLEQKAPSTPQRLGGFGQ
eukprot:scaffold183556_cov18-Tisochrysis_lutea.AAC.2